MRHEDLQDLVSKALRQAWQLGQTYCDQADSEYLSHNKQADVTQARFHQLIEETRAAIVTEPAFYAAFGAGGCALPKYSADTEEGVILNVLDAAREEGYNGSGVDRLIELSWVVRPVYA